MENAVQKRIVVKRFRRRQAGCGHCAQILPAIEAMQGSANRQAEPFLIWQEKTCVRSGMIPPIRPGAPACRKKAVRGPLFFLSCVHDGKKSANTTDDRKRNGKEETK